MLIGIWLIVSSVFFLPAQVLAHSGAHPPDVPWWKAWDSRPIIALNLFFILVLYAIGCFRQFRHSGIPVISPWRIGSFVIAILILFVALVSNVDTLAEKLSWIHMVQHILLMMFAAPFFIAGSPGQCFLWAFPLNWRRRFYRFSFTKFQKHSAHYTLTQPLLIWLLYATTLWIWHLPLFYETALQNPVIHDFQHLSFFVVACLFWKALLHPLENRRLNEGVTVLYLFLTSIHTIILGALMVLSPTVWYRFYEETTLTWGITPLEDQQLAGYIMWMPGAMMYAAIAVALCVGWLKRLQRRTIPV